MSKYLPPIKADKTNKLESRTTKKKKTESITFSAVLEMLIGPRPAKPKQSKKDRVRDIFAKYRDHEGKMEYGFSALQSPKPEQEDFLRWWKIADTENKNRISYARFINFLRLEKCEWSQRLFDIMNSNLTGALSFSEFLNFCVDYLLIDKSKTENFTFRYLSRRASTFNNNRTVLDLDDVKFFVRDRYDSKDIGQRHRRSLAIFSTMDNNGDGGLTLAEFQSFCDKSKVFVIFANKLLMYLRHSIFGLSFWVKRSREILRSKASTLTILTRNKLTANIESENYMESLCGVKLFDSKRKLIVSIEDLSLKISSTGDDILAYNVRRKKLLEESTDENAKSAAPVAPICFLISR